jgi:hypothetical protein
LITDNVNRTVPYRYGSEYIAMLMARQHFFSADILDLGFTDLEQHTIDLKDKDPVFSSQFRLPAEHSKMIQENVAGWLQAGIIERSRSPYNSPIFCVPKKEGQGLRCVLDYRRVNSSSFSDRYALRTIDECLETGGEVGTLQNPGDRYRRYIIRQSIVEEGPCHQKGLRHSRAQSDEEGNPERGTQQLEWGSRREV